MSRVFLLAHLWVSDIKRGEKRENTRKISPEASFVRSREEIWSRDSEKSRSASENREILLWHFNKQTTKYFSTQLVPYRRVIKTSFCSRLCTICLERWQSNNSFSILEVIVVHRITPPSFSPLDCVLIISQTKRLSTQSTGLNLFSKQIYVQLVGFYCSRRISLLQPW